MKIFFYFSNDFIFFTKFSGSDGQVLGLVIINFAQFRLHQCHAGPMLLLFTLMILGRSEFVLKKLVLSFSDGQVQQAIKVTALKHFHNKYASKRYFNINRAKGEKNFQLFNPSKHFLEWHLHWDSLTAKHIDEKGWKESLIFFQYEKNALVWIEWNIKHIEDITQKNKWGKRKIAILH